jgi:hypothetical protein
VFLLILGLILIILGVLQFNWVMKWSDKHMLERPLIFLKPILGKLISLLWLFLLVIGLYFVWQVNNTIGVGLTAALIILVIIKFKTRSIENKAKIIINLYKEIRETHLQTDEEETLKLTARKFLEMQGYNETGISSITELISSISERTSGILRIDNIEDLAVYLLFQVHPSKEITSEIDATIRKAVLQALKSL